MDYLPYIRKALVPIGVTAILGILSHVFGITTDMTVEDAVNVIVLAVVSAFGVWLVPNKK